MKRTRFLSMFAALCLPVTMLAMLGVGPAQADPLPEDQRMQVAMFMMPRVSSPAPGVAMVFVTNSSGAAPAAGTTYDVTLFSCDRLVGSDIEPYRTGTAGVQFAISLPTKVNTVGPILDVSVEVTQPGFDPYVLTTSQSMSERGLRTPSCEAVDAPDQDWDDPAVITKWSRAKTGKPQVGRKAVITPTRFAAVGNPSAYYLWFVGKKDLKNLYSAGGGRSIRVKPQWKGKPLYAVVWAYDSHLRVEDDVQKVISFGRVRG